ncbi:MAG: cupin domain-containing protein [Janthinobacterium lividum]
MAGLSYYLPGGRADTDSSPFEKSYIVLDGELEVTDGSGEAFTLRPFDSCHIAPGECRAVHNRTNRMATLLVIIPHKA